MADLPSDRMEAGPPFSFVGVDTFRPWPVTFRKTRGGHSNQNHWAILFTCLVSRAVHIELIEELSSASFINALQRFVAIRGPVKQYRSDLGTNFVGTTKELGKTPTSLNLETLESTSRLIVPLGYLVLPTHHTLGVYGSE
jgi:hypothetical protein